MENSTGKISGLLFYGGLREACKHSPSYQPCCYEVCDSFPNPLNTTEPSCQQGWQSSTLPCCQYIRLSSNIPEELLPVCWQHHCGVGEGVKFLCSTTTWGRAPCLTLCSRVEKSQRKLKKGKKRGYKYYPLFVWELSTVQLNRHVHSPSAHQVSTYTKHSRNYN